MSNKINLAKFPIESELKAKRDLEERYMKDVYRLESQIEKSEKELEGTLRELNEKEARIFDIQRAKLDDFKQEIGKYQNVYCEIDEKHHLVLSQLENSKRDEEQLYNHTGMFLEDYLSYSNEIVMLKKKVLELKDNLSEIEKTYPKEFEFLLQDIDLEKEMNEISGGKKQLQEEVDGLERGKKELYRIKENKTNEMHNLIEDIKKIEASIETGRKDNHLVKLEGITLSVEDKVKNKNLVGIYFKELLNREKILQASINKKRKCEENIENLAKEIEKLEDNLCQCENEINSKKGAIGEIITKEKIFGERIEMRNRNLTQNLEQLGEVEFEKYLKSNDQVLKNMKKVYGNKILDKVFKVQKQKFLETVIMDHSYKKGKVNEYIQFITRFESILEFYTQNQHELENNYKQTFRKYDGIQDYKEGKYQEKAVLEESKADLKEKMEIILDSQIKEIESDKRQLQFKFNLNYYIQKIKDVGEKISELSNNRETLLKEYENFNNIINEKEHKLYIEDLDLKNNLISLSMGVNEENGPMTHMPYKVNKSYESARKLEYNSEEEEEKFVNDNDNFNDLMKKSVAEYNQESIREDNKEEVNKREEENKSKINIK